MRTRQSNTPNRKRVLRRALLGALLLILSFLFGPAAIRTAYAFTTNSSEITALKERYRALDSTEHLLPAAQQQASARRRFQIANWLAMRGIVIDAGMRDEAVEHAAFPIALFGITRWAWSDIFGYWSVPSSQRTPQHLLSDVRSSAAQVVKYSGHD